MSYKCQVCRATSSPGTPMRRHTLHRPSTRHAGQEIAAEIVVCLKCLDDLQHGFPLPDLIEARRNQPVLSVQEVKARPEPEPTHQIPQEPIALVLAVAPSGKLQLIPEVVKVRKPSTRTRKAR